VSKQKYIKDLFGWLNEITQTKTPIEDISEESWKSWNSFMIHKYLSMDPNYIELVNYIQKIPHDKKQQIYSIYREMIPKRKVWLKYVGAKKKPQNKSAVEYIAKYFECSLGEAEEYMDLLREKGVRSLLYKMGIDDEEANKLLKEKNK
jgi:hypothetical protein